MSRVPPSQEAAPTDHGRPTHVQPQGIRRSMSLHSTASPSSRRRRASRPCAHAQPAAVTHHNHCRDAARRDCHLGAASPPATPPHAHCSGPPPRTAARPRRDVSDGFATLPRTSCGQAIDTDAVLRDEVPHRDVAPPCATSISGVAMHNAHACAAGADTRRHYFLSPL
jgi:hypothetical protein